MKSQKTICPKCNNEQTVTDECVKCGVIISKYPKGLAIDYMVISQLQRKALDTMTRYFEETGYGKQPISAAAKTVLARAKASVSSLAR